MGILSVVVFGIVATTLASAYLAVRMAGIEESKTLHRAVETLSQARYPVSQTVLEHMSGLSGGQFVLLDRKGRVVHSTMKLDAADVDALRALPRQTAPLRSASDWFAEGTVARLGGEDYLGQQVPLTPRTGADGDERLLALYPQGGWWNAARRLAPPIFAAGGVTALAAMLVSALAAYRFVRPIGLLRNQADRIADGHFQPVDLPPRNDELGDLARSINRMTEKLSRYEDGVRRHERLQVLGQLGAGIAHQLRNAATGARMAVELHRQETPEAAEAESLDIALRQLRLMESHLQRFLSLGRHEPSKHDRVALQSVVEEVLPLVRPGCEHAKIRLDCTLPEEPIYTLGDVHWLGQLLTNLVLNALEAAGRRMEGDSRVCVELERRSPGRAALRVANTGPEPEAAIRDRLFEPFVTDKAEGTGLGLYLVRQVAEDHGGTVGWERKGGMTIFTVELPTVA